MRPRRLPSAHRIRARAACLVPEWSRAHWFGSRSRGCHRRRRRGASRTVVADHHGASARSVSSLQCAPDQYPGRARHERRAWRRLHSALHARLQTITICTVNYNRFALDLPPSFSVRAIVSRGDLAYWCREDKPAPCLCASSFIHHDSSRLCAL